jgi:hypothetical protein
MVIGPSPLSKPSLSHGQRTGARHHYLPGTLNRSWSVNSFELEPRTAATRVHSCTVGGDQDLGGA